MFIDLSIHIYIYIYIYARCRVQRLGATWPSLGCTGSGATCDGVVATLLCNMPLEEGGFTCDTMAASAVTTSDLASQQAWLQL